MKNIDYSIIITRTCGIMRFILCGDILLYVINYYYLIWKYERITLIYRNLKEFSVDSSFFPESS